MEVHHHPHVEKKSFKEYLLEGLMIFLAVTMGFFAENIREHFAELKTVREYLSASHEELLRNKTNIENDQHFLIIQLPVVDSLITIFNTETENKDLKKTAYLFSKSITDYIPNIETVAYQKIVNSGGLKSIDSDTLKNYLAQYIDAIEKFKIFNERISNVLFNRFPDMGKHMDIYNIIKNKPNEVKPFPNLKLEDRRELICLLLDEYEQYRFAIKELNDIGKLNSKLLQIIHE
jgi:hypothetical protein